MHSISSAIRQLSHRSTNLGGNGTSNRMNANNGLNANNGRNLAAGRNGANNGAGRARMTQAQSDTRLGQALRTTQGIHMQMSNQNSYSSSLHVAHRHVARAMNEMHTALTTR